MSAAAIKLGTNFASPRPGVRDYLALTKPRVVAMVLVTTFAGFYLGGVNFDYLLALGLLAGTALAAAGTLALNQYIERDRDAMMMRTRMRPIPDGRITPNAALAFGVVTMLAGLAILAAFANPLTAGIVASITAIYLFAYTPLKRVSWVCSLVGAIPGALPPVAGWAAARGAIGIEPMVVFAIMYVWQLPHSLAIARLYEKDYARAGFKMLPADGPARPRTRAIVVANCVALIAAAALPTLMGFAGIAYLVVAAAVGFGFLFFALRMETSPALAAARNVVLASVVYLPVVLLVMALDRL
jgi:heme o synthase